jgi:hypothetical protein
MLSLQRAPGDRERSTRCHNRFPRRARHVTLLWRSLFDRLVLPQRLFSIAQIDF